MQRHDKVLEGNQHEIVHKKGFNHSVSIISLKEVSE